MTASNIANNPTTDTTNWKSYVDNNSPNVLDNVGFTATVATKALTFALKTRNLTDPTSTDKVRVAFRSETLTTGDNDIIEVEAAQSIIVPDGATLGVAAGETRYIYFYEISNTGVAEAAVSGSLFDEAVLHSTTAIDATADSGSVLYSTTARTNVPIRLVGRIRVETGAVAGEWDNAPTELFIGEPIGEIPFSESFLSSEQTITSSGNLTIPHGLNSPPSLLQARLICKTAEGGYSIDDEVLIAFGHDSSASDAGYGVSCVPDNTNLNIRYGVRGSVFQVNSKTTGDRFAITNANWRLILRAWT